MDKKWSWDEEADDVSFSSDDFKVSDELLATLKKKKEPKTSSKKEEELNVILPIGVSSTLWKHFGFPVNWCDLIWSRAKVICRLCKEPLVVETDAVLKMRVHLQQSHPEVDIQSEHMAAITQIPSYKFPTEEEAEKFEDEEEDEPSEKGGDDDDEDGSPEEETEEDNDDEEEKEVEDTEHESSEEAEEPNHEDQVNAIVNFCIKIMRPGAFEDLNKLCRVPLEGFSEDVVYSLLPTKYKEARAKFSLEELLGPSGQCSLSFEVWSRGSGHDEFLTVSVNYLDLKEAVPQLKNKILFTRKTEDVDREVWGHGTPKKDFFETLQSEWGLKKEQIVAAVCSIEMMRSSVFGEDQTAVPVVFCFLDFLDKLVQQELFSLPKVDWMIRQCCLEKFSFDSTYLHTYWDDYLFKLKNRLSRPGDYELDKEQVFLLKQLMVVLEYVYVALVTYREEQPFGHLSILAPILGKMLSHFQPCEQDNPILSRMKQTVVAFTKRTYHKVMPLLFEATQLDPRFRGELNPNKDQTQKAACEKGNEVQQELAKFGKGAPTDFLIGGVTWWGRKEAQEEFPLLLPLVHKFQCVPGSCIPHSRVQGNDFEFGRHELKEEFVDSFLFLWSNHQLLD